MAAPATGSPWRNPDSNDKRWHRDTYRKNFLNWCSVEINGGSASADATVTASIAASTVATIVATPSSSSFQVGPDPWFGVDQNGGASAAGTDVGSGVSESSTANGARRIGWAGERAHNAIGDYRRSRRPSSTRSANHLEDLTYFCSPLINPPWGH
jgi:hypothetical protein